MLNCLSQLSFAGGSVPGSAAMIVSQTGTAALDAAQNLRDDTGQTVPKKYLVGQLTSFIGQEWKASVTANRDGFVDDSSSYAYLDETSRISDLIDTFAQHPDLATDVHQTAKALDDYVEMVDRRNRAVDRYNDGIRRLACLTGESDRLDARATAIGKTIAKKSDPGTAAWADYYSGLTDQVQFICLDNLARAYRAASFWCLHDLGSFQQWTAGNPGAITATALSTAFTMLKGALGEALDDFHRLPNVFGPPPTPPSAAGGWSPGGVLIVLTPDAHPWFFRQLRRCAHADFELVPPHQGSLAPTTHDAPTAAARAVPDPPDRRRSAHPAARRCRRYTQPLLRQGERAADHGPSLDRGVDHHERQPHGRHGAPGSRAVPDRERRPLPGALRAGSYLDHEPVTIPFSYNASAYRFDVHKGFASTAWQEGEDIQDGNLVFNTQAAEAGAALPAPASYAPIGPFGVWRLHIDPNDNPGADLSTVRRIIIDFHGFSDGRFA